MGELAATCNDVGAGARAGGGAAVGTVKGFMGAAEREVAMTGHGIPEGEDGEEAFAEILAVMGVEELIRIRHRLGKLGRERMVELLSEELAGREE